MNVLKAIFEQVGFPDSEFCQGCEFDEVTEDQYGTGDSPAEHNCIAMPDECPAAKNELIEAFNEDWS